MSGKLHKIIRLTFLVSTLGGAGGVLAADAAGSGDGADKVEPPLARDYPRLCNDLVGSFLTDSRYQAVIAQSPIDSASICACVEAPLRADPHIGPLFTTRGENLLALDPDRFSTYFGTKVASEIMVCLGGALSRATSKFDPHPQTKK